MILVPLYATTARPGPHTDWAYLLWNDHATRSWWAT